MTFNPSIAIFIFLLFALVGCTQNKLTVRTEYINREHLASFHVETPDPLLLDPPLGQRLIAQWKIPRDYLSYENLHLRIRLRFRNRQEEVKEVPISRMRGLYCYELLNEDFCEKLGILSYLVELRGNDNILEEWRHQLWVELIQFQDDIKCHE